LKNLFVKEGAHVELLKKEGNDFHHKESPRLLHDFRVGNVCKVGSIFARTMAWQDYWRTSLVTEIQEVLEKDNTIQIIFKTLNSIYKLITHKDNVKYPEKFDELSDLEKLEERDGKV